MKKNSKKLLSSLLATVMVLCCLPIAGVTFSASAENSGYYTYTVENGEATITECDTSISGDVVIPDTLGGYPVTRIGSDAFNGCTGLTSVIIPDSVTNIGNYAFYRCTGLTSITIPDSVTSIGKDAFLGCTGLTSVTIGNSVTSIGDYAFSYCEKLRSITIPNSVTSIGYEAFYNCTGLTSITIPDSVTYIGYGAFRGCTGVTSITIPANVTDIGNNAFGYYYYGDKKVENFTIYGYSNTAAETYAHANGFSFVSHDNGHAFSEWLVTTEPTCTTEGEEIRTCSVCGESETRAIEKAAHKIVIDTSVTPTCTETGVTEGQHCSVCGEVLVEQQTIAAAGHNDNNSDGICDSCGENLGTHTPSENCSCSCHKKGIANFFFKILLFFQKLFKKNQVCKCGAWHY
ncbi:MAG: leucine-rich repeat domain-containing protein [Clostridiaceae bacterium]|nr:leucine-rich repeat domain-containing protein [Clostridiaceae bacterium]